MHTHSPFPNNDETPDTGSHEDAVADERLRLASLVIDQYELPFPDMTGAALTTVGRARFVVGIDGLTALIDKGRLRHTASNQEERGTFEVLSARLRLTTSRGSIAVRASIPLEPSSVAIPAGGLRFETDLRALRQLCAHSGGIHSNVAWQVVIDLKRSRIELRECGRTKHGQTVGAARYRLRAIQAGSGTDLLDEFSEHVCRGRIDGELTSRAIKLCSTVLRKDCQYPFVEIAHGVARGFDPAALMIVTAPALQGVQLMIPAADCANVARILRRMKDAQTHMFETATGITIRDGIVELAIGKQSTVLPSTKHVAAIAMTSSTRLRDDDLVQMAIFCDLPLDLHRGRLKRRASDQRSAASAEQLLMTMRRAGPDVLGMKFKQRECGVGWRHFGPLAFHPPTFDDTTPTLAEDSNEGSPAAAMHRNTPEVWGTVDAMWLRKLCAPFTQFETTMIGHCGNSLRIAANDATLSAQCFLRYLNVEDRRFETPNSKVQSDDFERNIALFGSQFLRRNTEQSIAKQEDFVDLLHAAQGISGQPQTNQADCPPQRSSEP